MSYKNLQLVPGSLQLARAPGTLYLRPVTLPLLDAVALVLLRQPAHCPYLMFGRFV